MEQFGRGRESSRYKKYIEVGLAQSDEEFTDLMREKGVAIGSSAFIEEVKELHRQVAEEHHLPEDISFRHIQTYRTPDEVTRAVADALQLPELLSSGRRSYPVERGFLAWALQHYAGLAQREAAPRLDLQTGAAVSVAIKRFHSTASCEEWKQGLYLLFKG